jgi:hypothetical protein
MELCGNKAAWQIVPEGITSINLENVGQLIEAAGYEVGLRTRLCWTFLALVTSRSIQVENFWSNHKTEH